MDRPLAENYYELTGNFKTVTGEDVLELNKDRYIHDLAIYSKEIAEKYADLVIRYSQMSHEYNKRKKSSKRTDTIKKPCEVLEDDKFYTIFDIQSWLYEQIEDCGENSEWKGHFEFVKREIDSKIVKILKEYKKPKKEEEMKPYEELIEGKFYTIFEVLGWLKEQIGKSEGEYKQHYQFVKREIVGKEADIILEYYE